MRARGNPDQDASALLCCVEGCGRKWTSDFGRRLCSEHLRGGGSTKPLPLPTRQPERPYAEPADRDEQGEF